MPLTVGIRRGVDPTTTQVGKPRTFALLFFALVSCAIAIAIACNVPMCYDGAFYFFSALDQHRFAISHGRPINVLLQAPMFAALHFTANAHLLRIAFCAGYAAVPLLCLWLCWELCRKRNPSLLIWPAMAICLATLPGQFCFISESTLAITVMWPALITVLVSGPWLLYAVASAAAVEAHLNSLTPLAITIAVACVSAILHQQSRKSLLTMAAIGGLLFVHRATIPLDHYEHRMLGLHTIRFTFHVAVLGWPLLAVGFSWLAALACLRLEWPIARRLFILSIMLSGVALVIWARNPADWRRAADYRYWVGPFSLIFMAAAAYEALWASPTEEASLDIRFTALPVIGAIFLMVLALQSLTWEQMSHRLITELVNSGRGCVPIDALPWTAGTAMDHWSVSVYAADLQGQQPWVLLLPSESACRTFAETGDAVLASTPNWQYVRRSGEGWFDFGAARKIALGGASTAVAAGRISRP
jgi:hypothetical protein